MVAQTGSAKVFGGIAAAVVSVAWASAQTLTDDFARYRDGDEGAPAWEATAVGIAMRGGAVEADGGVLTWRAAPYAAALTFACDVTLLAETGAAADWLTAGIGIASDERNYWQLNVVRAPEKDKHRHYTELQECLDGTWLAQTIEGTRLPRLEGKGEAFDWQLGQTYRLELELAPERLRGSIRAGDTEVARIVYDLENDTRAVRAGRPCLRASGMKIRFDNASLTVTQTAAEPPEVRREFPPWVSTGREGLTKGTGFFATFREPDGRWWLVDPEGRAFFDVGTDHCNYSAHWCQKLGYAPYNRNMQAKYGSPEKWAESATTRLKSWSFNTVAAGHHPATRHRGLCHVLFASFGSRFARRDWICEPIHWTGFPNVFSPDWERHCRLVAREMARESRGDPWCIGVFVDNELEWYGKKGFLVDELFQLGREHTGKRAFWDWLVQHYGDVAGVNRALATSYADAAAFLAAATVPPSSAELGKVRAEFLAVIAERYFRPTYEAMKAADPDHMVMGTRFAGGAPEPTLAAAGQFTDVFTINTYPRVDLDTGRLLDVQRQFRGYYATVKKPFVITEWSFPALDSNLPCRHGAGMRVDTQAQKARCYDIFANAMIDLPFLVGYHYFMWVDEPAEGISDTFPEDSNYGLVNVNDEPYAELVTTATRVNAAAHERHRRAQDSGDLEMTLEKGVLHLRNTGTVPARARLTALVDGQVRTVDASVPGAATVTPPGLDWGKATYVLLEQWDGSVTRVAPAGTGGATGQALNAGLQPLAGVPAVAEAGPLALAWIKELAPGQAQPLTPPAAELKPVERLDLTTERAAFRCASRTGRFFDGVGARQAGQPELHLGHLDFATHQIVNGQHQWVTPDALEEMAVAEHTDAWVVEAVLVRQGEANVVTAVDAAGQPAVRQTGPARYRARVRAVVFKAAPLALVRPLWVESLDERPWQLVDCFWFCRPAIGGQEVDDRKGGPDVPNYYRHAEYWTDAKLGGAFGAASPDRAWTITFWRNEAGGFHPDARRAVEQELTAKGKRWEATGWSYLWVYALRTEAEVSDTVARGARAADLIVPR